MDGQYSPSERSNDSSSHDERFPILRRNYTFSFMGRLRTMENIGQLEWLFIFFSLSMICIGLCFTIFRMINIDPGSDQFLFAILVLLNFAFATYYLVHGILQEQPFEILTYVLTTLIIAILVTINFTSSEVEDYLIRVIRFIVTIFFSIPNVAMAIKIGHKYWESGPFVFKAVGGDMFLQRICRMYLLGLSLLIFDVQAMLSCLVLIMKNGFGDMTPEEIFLFSFGVAFTTIWLMVGYFAMRTESKQLTWLFVLISFIQPLYVLYLYVGGLDEVKRPDTVRGNSAYFAGVVLLLVHFSFLAILPLIGRNYGKGLKEAIYGASQSNNSSVHSRTSHSSVPPTEGPNYDEIFSA